jgi:hypothetical protein
VTSAVSAGDVQKRRPILRDETLDLTRPSLLRELQETLPPSLRGLNHMFEGPGDTTPGPARGDEEIAAAGTPISRTL